MAIALTKFEVKLFEAIRNFISVYLPTTTARVAGGWVRDKLLNRQSNDIDIVLDTHSGVSFLTLFKEKSSLVQMSNIGVIKVNPEKSKHLETAVVIIDGNFIDFMQLRTESYDKTRIPVIKQGTIQEDVYRRDLTINALYYNINEDKIEDWTGFGINDLNDKIIRTPLDSRITFLDDPLRILRAVRFMVQLNFTIKDEIIIATKCKDVRLALRTKLSNERVGIEIMKIIKAENGYKGIMWFIENDLVCDVFKPENYSRKVCFKDDSKTDAGTLCKTENNSQLTKNLQIDVKKVKHFIQNFKTCKFKLDNHILNLYTLLHVFSGQSNNSIYINVKIVKDTLKWTKLFAKRIQQIEDNIKFLTNNKIEIDNCQLIIIIRQMGKDWLNSFMIYHFIQESKHIPAVVDFIFEKRYDKAYETQPILNGSEIYKKLNCKKEEIQKFKEMSVAYQISMNISSDDELIKLLKEYKLKSEKIY